MNLSACKLVLIYGGTFDPPHVAHVRMARMALEQTGADAVAYVPAAVSPFKVSHKHTPAEHRLAMLQLALADQPWAVILTDELERAATQPDRPSYTIETLDALQARLGPVVKLRLLIGGDQVKLFDQWRESQRIETIAEPLVMVRPPETREQLLARLGNPLLRERWAKRMLDLPPMDASATAIRAKLCGGESVTGLLCPAVEKHIREHGLYR